MGDTKVEGGNPERASQMAEEVIGMMESIKAVKGEAYCEAIQGIFTLHNLIGILILDNTHMQVKAGVPIDQTTAMNIPIVRFVNLLVDTMAGITGILAANFVGPYQGKEEYEERHQAKAKEMMKDIEMLMRKQDEYNNGGKARK